MIEKPLNRRQFLQTSGMAVTGLALSASCVMLIASDGAWAMSLHALDAPGAQSLMVMARRLYPHPTLGDMYYAKVVSDLDDQAKGNATLGAQLKDGVAALDGAKGIPWLELSEGNQTEVLTGMESTAFFQTVRNATVAGIYNNPLVWRHFGYEGSSFEEGGYRYRGFNDLAWLPDPPATASPPVE
jgi:hypothetical protein